MRTALILYHILFRTHKFKPKNVVKFNQAFISSLVSVELVGVRNSAMSYSSHSVKIRQLEMP